VLNILLAPQDKTDLITDLQAVRKADQQLSILAREVTTTSTTLSGLGRLLEHNDGTRLYTQGLVDDAKSVFDDCHTAFVEVETTFKSVVRFDSSGKG
jgi:hypothetical protein